VRTLVLLETEKKGDDMDIQGVWKLVSLEVESQATGQKEHLMGQHPTGYVIFTPERAMFLLTGEGRKPGKTDRARAELLNSIIAYTGSYRLEGDQWITDVDVAWDPEWVGTEQRRFFKVDGNRLQVITVWRVNPNWPEKGMGRGVLTFERSK
jgi:hypothetical protein